MNILPMPPGAIAKAHYHNNIETIAYMLEGEFDLQNRVLVQHGEQCCVAADMPHAPRNESGMPCTWIVVHSSGSDEDAAPECSCSITSPPLLKYIEWQQTTSFGR
jgi:uncharacterized RmlC-like cupin family protein